MTDHEALEQVKELILSSLSMMDLGDEVAPLLDALQVIDNALNDSK